MTRNELLQEIQDAKVAWEAATILVSPEEQEAPLLDGWSVRDVIAHLMWHEQEMVGAVRARALVGSDWWLLPTQERNRLVWEQHRDMPLAEAREAARDAHEALVKELEALADEDLTAHWPGVPDEWQPWQIIAQNTYEHYRDHTADVERYLAGRAR
jgi:hypothetical protein